MNKQESKENVIMLKVLLNVNKKTYKWEGKESRTYQGDNLMMEIDGRKNLMIEMDGRKKNEGLT